ncbi:uncharacterized protein LOC126673524 [Mercurialis annua]|uniref:uncharacterized protein LOC126673524 n=1 Tax=Mercurialis annua TaxID=3986 RepID=UPI00215F7550|nr:uncharacterized protein LOC126673524 [Mercurialis annua]
MSFDLPSSPFYLHSNENPSMILISSLLNGPNFHSWYRSMRMSLLIKNKLKFVDGSIPVPSKNDQIYPVWERCNTMILSWIIHSLSPSIAQSIFWIENALDVWTDLANRFSQTDTLRMSDLQDEIYGFKQNNMSVNNYFTQLKILWDEYLNLRPIPVCSCNPQCHCDALKKVKDFQERNYAMRFLKGLNENFSVIKTQVLMMDPLPKINRVFSLAAQHERQIAFNVGSLQILEPSVFTAQSNSSFQRNNSPYRPPNSNFNFYKPPVTNLNTGSNFRPQGGQKRFYSLPNNGKPMCSFCGMPGYSVDICDRKHGFPPGYKSRYRPQSFVNQVGEVQPQPINS